MDQIKTRLKSGQTYRFVVDPSDSAAARDVRVDVSGIGKKSERLRMAGRLLKHIFTTGTDTPSWSATIGILLGGGGFARSARLMQLSFAMVTYHKALLQEDPADVEAEVFAKELRRLGPEKTGPNECSSFPHVETI